MACLPAGTRIGHTHLRVADLDRALAFYRDALGFEVTYREADMVFLAAGGYHHHVALNTLGAAGPPPPGSAGLDHHAIALPDRRSLAAAVARLIAAGFPPRASVHHGLSEACYFRDPDGNGVELCVDMPPEAWPRGADGGIRVETRPVELDDLLAELEGEPGEAR